MRGQGRAVSPIGKRVYLMVDDDADRARDRVLAGLRRIYDPMRGIEDVPVCGRPDDVAAGLRAVRDAGAEMILLNPVGDTVTEDREQMERLAAEVLPTWTSRSGDATGRSAPRRGAPGAASGSSSARPRSRSPVPRLLTAPIASPR